MIKIRKVVFLLMFLLVLTFGINVNAYDIITGYRADDSYFSFARDFLKNSITVSQLSRSMELGKLGLQVVLHSEKAFFPILSRETRSVRAIISHFWHNVQILSTFSVSYAPHCTR